MRTTLDLDKTLMERLVKESHAASKTEAIHLAAQEYLKMLAREKLIQSFGTWKIEPHYKSDRKRSASEGAAIAKKMKGLKLGAR